MPQSIPNMAQMMSMLQFVADKANPLQRQLNPLAGTEGARTGGTARAGAIQQPDGSYTHPDWPGRTFLGPEDVPAPQQYVHSPVGRATADVSLSEAAARGAKFHKAIETLETSPDIFVHLKPGYSLPGGDTAFGADSLKEVREMMKSVIKAK